MYLKWPQFLFLGTKLLASWLSPWWQSRTACQIKYEKVFTITYIRKKNDLVNESEKCQKKIPTNRRLSSCQLRARTELDLLSKGIFHPFGIAVGKSLYLWMYIALTLRNTPMVHLSVFYCPKRIRNLKGNCWCFTLKIHFAISFSQQMKLPASLMPASEPHLSMSYWHNHQIYLKPVCFSFYQQNSTWATGISYLGSCNSFLTGI